MSRPTKVEILRKWNEADTLLAFIYHRLVEMGFAQDEPINGGDCVEQVAEIFELIKSYRSKS